MGRALLKALPEAGCVVAGYDVEDFDITDAAAVNRAVREFAPDVVVNCAAFTRVDDCEDAREECFKVNAYGAGVVAAAAREAGAFLVHLSTDYVFDGATRVPYGEDAPCRPLSAYGRSKWEGERRVRATGGECAVVRTAWLFGAGGVNFVAKVISKIRKGERLRVVNDQIGSPTYAGHLAAALAKLIALRLTGTYHVAGTGVATWYDVARATCRLVGAAIEVEPIATRELRLPAARPPFSALDCRRFERATGYRMPPWEEGLVAYLKEMGEVA